MRGLLTCMMVVMLVATLVSCGGDRNDCSVDYITINFETEEPLFELAKKSDLLKELSKSELEYKRDIVSGLNLAVSDRIDLASMLKGEGVYSEDGFIFVAFLENLQSFADENYPKAKKMFPDMTCEEFYYCSAVGYAVANSNRKETTSLEVEINYKDYVITIDPSLDEIMMHGFWNAYFTDIYDVKFNNNTTNHGEHISIELDTPASIELFVESQLILRKLFTHLNEIAIELDIGYLLVDGMNKPNDCLSKQMLTKLYKSGLKKGSYKLTDDFVEIGTESAYMFLDLLEMFSLDNDIIKLGHTLAISKRYITRVVGTDSYIWDELTLMIAKVVSKHQISLDDIFIWETKNRTR